MIEGSGSFPLSFKFNTSLEHNDLQLFRESQRGENYGCHRHEQRQLKVLVHRVDRVLSIFSNRRNLDSPTPSPTFACGKRGGGVPISDEGTDTVVLYLCTYVLCVLVYRQS
jgi:hypothetical protein